MPYPGAHRHSKQSWNELKEAIAGAEDEHLMEGIVAGCAIVAYADGWVTDAEYNRMLSMIRSLEPIATFGLADVNATFRAWTDQLAADQKSGEAAALKAVARVKRASRYPALLVEACCAIAAADGGFDAEERKAIIRICKVLGLDPDDFEVADAP